MNLPILYAHPVDSECHISCQLAWKFMSFPVNCKIKWQSNNVTDIRTEVKHGSAADGVCQTSSKLFKNLMSSKFFKDSASSKKIKMAAKVAGPINFQAQT